LEPTDPVAAKITGRLAERLQHLVDIGLGYLSLVRETARGTSLVSSRSW
jgi:excinuclease UvrABC ATPase subunit